MSFFPTGRRGGGGLRAGSTSAKVASAGGVIYTVKTGLKPPVAYSSKGGHANLSLPNAAGEITAGTSIAPGTSQTVTFLATGADGCVQPWSVTLTARPRTLPALPLTLPRVAIFGDSQSQFNHALFGGTGATIPAPTYKGPMVAAWSKDPRFSIDTWADPADPLARGINGANQGLAADHLRNQTDSVLPGGGMVARMPYVIERQPDVVVLNSPGTNTIHSGDVDGGSNAPTAAYVISKVDELINGFVGAGIYIIITTIYPRNWAGNDVRHGIAQTVNDWIRQQATRLGVLGIVDPYDALRMPNDVQPNLKYFLEESAAPSGIVHLNGNGANLVADMVNAVMA